MSTGSGIAAAVTVEVELPGLLRDTLGGREPLAATGTTLAEALDDLFRRHPLLRIHLYEEGGGLRRHVLLFHNDENVGARPAAGIALRPGDRVTVLQAVSGG